MFFDPAYQSLKNGLVGYWSPVATGPTGLQLLDLSGQNNHGTLNGMDAPTDWVDSPYGKVLDFDNAYDYINIGDTKLTLLQCTIAGWFNFRSKNGYDGIINSRVGGSSTGLIIEANGVRAAYNWNGLYYNYQGGPIIPLNRWVFIGVIISATQGQVFQVDDGVFSSGVNVAPHTSASLSNLRLGHDSYDPNARYFDGQMAGAAIWNRELSQSEIQTLYSIGPGKLLRRNPNVAIAKRKWWPGVKTPKSRPIIPTQRGIKSGPVFYDPKASWFRNGLVGHWCPNLTGPTGTQLLDLSGQNNNGVLTGMDAPTDWVQTEKGLVLDFDGSNDGVSTNATNHITTNQVTASIWFKPGRLTRGDLLTRWFGGGVGDQFNLLYGLTSGKPQFYVRGVTNILANTAMNVDQWYLINGVYGNGAISIYMNGVLDRTVAASGTMATDGTTQSYSICRNLSTDGYAQGQCAEALVHERALTASEIQQLYQRGPGGFASRIPKRRAISYSPAPKKIFKSRIDRKRSVSFVHPDHDNEWVTNGLVGFWCPGLTSATGTQLLDLSGQNNNGTLTNMDAPTDWVSSPYGTVLDFDGTNDYVTTSSKNYDYITLSGWVKVNAGATAFLINKNYNGANVPFSLSAYASAGIVSGFAFFDGLWRSTGIGTSDIRGDGLWHHIAGTFDGTNLLYYVDGKVAASNTVTAGVLPKNNNPIDIGVYRNDSNHFGGQIASACIHDRALTSSEIQTLYQLGPRMGFSRRPSRSPTWMVEADETIGNRRRRIICGGKN